jgi:long-chain acyl-CoA synthetase
MVCQSPLTARSCMFNVLSTVATFGYVDLDTPGVLTTLPEIFDSGYAASKNSPFLGQRPVVSKNPLTYAHHYVWHTYAEVEERRRHIGSAIHTLFENGTVGGGEYPTVGLWSSNRPGIFLALAIILSVNF